jgi:hypothetical protein
VLCAVSVRVRLGPGGRFGAAENFFRPRCASAKIKT